MSEAPEVTPEPAATAPVVVVQSPEAPKPTETVEFWKQKAREQESRAKSNAEAATELQKIKERDLTELQVAQKRADDADKRAAQLERTSLQQQVALEKGIPADLVGSLNGSTADELAAHADRLLAWRGSATPPPIPQPQPDMGQGARPADTQAQQDAEYAEYQAKYFN